MNKILHFAVRGLVAAAGSRAKYVKRTLAQVGHSPATDFRSNAGGWN